MNIESAPTSEKEMTYEEALLYCTFCNHNGNTDWRLPTRDECEYLAIYTMWYLNDPSSYWEDYVMPVRDV